MKRINAVLTIAVFVLLTCNVMAQDMQKKTEAKPKAAKAKAALPTADADILKCIQDKFAGAASLKDKPPSVTVSGGTATITGEAKNGGAKGAATRYAKGCGAKQVKNDMTVAAGAKKAEKKPAEKKN
ncbi:MAG: BON domain-containing protein [Acidobacteria bacterium]|nr:BON domain-containing protein [Acidobacteriota bacterium]MBI3421924.1 BON domain-containing protein [Acidobacteriota bacterium]